MQTKLLIGALALGCAMALPIGASVAAPPPPSFSFDLNIGGGGPSGPGPGFGPHPPRRDFRDDQCLSPREIMGELADQGYSRFTPVDRGRHTFTIDARRGFRWYELTVDSCSGDVVDRQRIMHP